MTIYSEHYGQENISPPEKKLVLFFVRHEMSSNSSCLLLALAAIHWYISALMWVSKYRYRLQPGCWHTFLSLFCAVLGFWTAFRGIHTPPEMIQQLLGVQVYSLCWSKCLYFPWDSQSPTNPNFQVFFPVFLKFLVWPVTLPVQVHFKTPQTLLMM